MKPTIGVALSGGIDSLVAAYLLKQQGYPVIGLHFITGYAAPPLSPDLPVTPASEPRVAAIAGIGEQLDIPIHFFDCRDRFEAIVVDYFVGAYREGKTPNPCLVCNPAIKFGALMSFAKSCGADKLATGHYARTRREGSGRYQLLKGRDPRKDQAYFLAFLSQQQLAEACFPLGEMTKSDVKQFADTNGLKPVTSGESQDICFVDHNSYVEFLADRGLGPHPGPIVNRNGDVLGRHPGLHHFTIGQRRGIGCPAAEPYYVVRIDTRHNRLVVGHKQELLETDCHVTGINWIDRLPKAPFRAATRIRYHHEAAPAVVTPTGATTATVAFDQPQTAVTPGQGAVFFDGDAVVGGGWIIQNPSKIRQ